MKCYSMTERTIVLRILNKHLGYVRLIVIMTSVLLMKTNSSNFHLICRIFTHNFLTALSLKPQTWIKIWRTIWDKTILPLDQEMSFWKIDRTKFSVLIAWQVTSMFPLHQPVKKTQSLKSLINLTLSRWLDHQM